MHLKDHEQEKTIFVHNPIISSVYIILCILNVMKIIQKRQRFYFIKPKKERWDCKLRAISFDIYDLNVATKFESKCSFNAEQMEY